MQLVAADDEAHVVEPAAADGARSRELVARSREELLEAVLPVGQQRVGVASLWDRSPVATPSGSRSRSMTVTRS